MENRDATITTGIHGFFKDLGGAVTNIVIQPVKGAKKEGIIGFFKGAGRGVLGVVLRPVGGLLDLTAITAERLRK